MTLGGRAAARWTMKKVSPFGQTHHSGQTCGFQGTPMFRLTGTLGSQSCFAGLPIAARFPKAGRNWRLKIYNERLGILELRKPLSFFVTNGAPE